MKKRIYSYKYIFRKQGTAIIVVVAALMVLSTLGITFVRLQSIERQVSSASVDTLRARLAAMAGIERTFAELKSLNFKVWDEVTDSWIYKDNNGTDVGAGIPIETAQKPSFLAGNTSVSNPKIPMARGRAYSGVLPNTYEPYGDTYVLKIIDSASQINLNTPYLKKNMVLEKEILVGILENLWRALDYAEQESRDDAEAIVAFRDTFPDKRFRSKEDILKVPGITQAKFNKVKDFISVHSWFDSTLIRPQDPNRRPTQGSKIFNRYNYGNLVHEKRSPININTAPKPVLVAVIADLSATYINEQMPGRTTGIDFGYSLIPEDHDWYAIGTAEITPTISLPLAKTIADEIISNRKASHISGDYKGPFRSWNQFNLFVDYLVTKGTITSIQGDVIKANFNPNTDLNKFNPNSTFYRCVDKLDFINYTTEFCFSSMGYFYVESLGRVTSNNGITVSEWKIDTNIRAYAVVRDTDQVEFMKGTIKSSEIKVEEYQSIGYGFLSGGDLWFHGNGELTGPGGSVHTNANFRINGNPTIEHNATASGTLDVVGSPNIGGDSGGNRPTVFIPSVNPDDFKQKAQYIFTSTGVVKDQSGNQVASGSYLGFTFRSGEWKGGGGIQDGTFYFETDVNIQANGSATITILATGNIDVSGRPNFVPHTTGLLFVSGKDIRARGTPGSSYSGYIAAHEQVDFGGNTTLTAGSIIAEDAAHTSSLVETSILFGDAEINCTGDLPPIWVGERTIIMPTLQTYPEPDITITEGGQTRSLPSTCFFDGQLMLAALEQDEQILEPQPYTNRMLCHWKDKLDASLGGGVLGLVADSSGPVLGSVLGNPLGNLFPDGVYSELRATPAYSAFHNVHGTKGTVLFWIKPNWDTSKSNRSHHLFTLSRHYPCYNDPASCQNTTQEFQFAYVTQWAVSPYGSADNTVGFNYETWTKQDDGYHKRMTYLSYTLPAHKWTHLAITWDFNSQTYDGAIKIFINGQKLNQGAPPIYTQDYTLPVQGVEDITTVPATGPNLPPQDAGNLIRIGERRGHMRYGIPDVPPEATIDELIILDSPKDENFIYSIYSQGRYMPTGEASYKSPPISLSGLTRLQTIGWTIYYPATGYQGDLEFSIVRGDDSVIAGIYTGEGGATILRPLTGVPVVESGIIHYKIDFKVTPKDSVALFDTPVLDDVTVTYCLKSPEIFMWSEGRSDE